MKKENVHKDHRQRVRQRFLNSGLDAFAEHEVLEMLLFYCYPQKDTNEIAHRMIKEFGTLYNLLEADAKELMTRLGVSENIAVLLTLMPQLANWYFRSKWSRNTVINSAKIAGQYAISLFVGRTTEAFYVFNLDMQLRLNHVSLIAEGTLDETAVYPREIVAEALKHQATAIILAHNHPGGALNPSRKDIEVTRKIVAGLEFMKIEVLDHIVVAGDKYYSFAARGQIVAGY